MQLGDGIESLTDSVSIPLAKRIDMPLMTTSVDSDDTLPNAEGPTSTSSTSSSMPPISSTRKSAIASCVG